MDRITNHQGFYLFTYLKICQEADENTKEQ
jgi:hypothetical protein